MKLIDSDLHIAWTEIDELAHFVPEVWHHRLSHGSGHSQGRIPVTQPFYDPREKAGRNGFTTPCEVRNWMNSHRVDRAVLNSWHAPAVSNFGDADYPSHVAEAYNRWLVERWLNADERFLGSITVATQDPMTAAHEIRRAASHPRVVQVLLSAGTLQPYGKRHYRPIFEAAVECGLAVCIHGGTEGVGVSNPPSTHGWPRNLLEYRVCPITNFIGHLTSMITEGLFTQYPDLTLVGLEVGGALPLITYLWRFDKNYKALRSECPWVTRLPSEIVRDHVRLGTQSSAIGNEELYFDILSNFGADHSLLWTSNTPRWDAQTPSNDPHLAPRPKWEPEAVGFRNAAALYTRNFTTSGEDTGSRGNTPHSSIHNAYP